MNYKDVGIDPTGWNKIEALETSLSVQSHTVCFNGKIDAVDYNIKKPQAFYRQIHVWCFTVAALILQKLLHP